MQAMTVRLDRMYSTTLVNFETDVAGPSPPHTLTTHTNIITTMGNAKEAAIMLVTNEISTI